MKKKLLYIAAIVICLSIITSGTLAYFTASETARNVITSGGISVEIVEQQMTDGVLTPYPSEPIPVMPGATVSKIVSVRNLEQTAWIRVQYSVSAYDAAGDAMPVTAEELQTVVGITPDETNWTLRDGWWYYNAAVETDAMTAPLFSEVVFSGPLMDNKYQGSTIVIDVDAQAVQFANNGETVMEALGWPEN